MEKVSPAGAKIFGYASEIAPVERLLIGRPLAKKFTTTMATYVTPAKIFISMFFNALLSGCIR